MSDEETAEGWAGFAAPEEGSVILVPLTPVILRAGEPLAERARERALERFGDLGVAQDLLAGNALYALRDDRNPRGAIAACLGGIAHLTQSHCFVVTAILRGHGADCDVQRLDRDTAPASRRATVRRRLAEIMEIPAKQIVPGSLLTRKVAE